MRTAKRMLLSAVCGFALTASSYGQGGGQQGGGTTQGGSGGVNSNTNNNETFSELVTIPAVSGITSGTTGRTAAGASVSSQNFLSSTYWNPMTLGLPGTTNTSGASGFGVATFGTSTGGGAARGGTQSVGTAGGGRATTQSSSTGTSFGSQIGGTGNTGITGATGFGGSTASGFGTATGGRGGTTTTGAAFGGGTLGGTTGRGGLTGGLGGGLGGRGGLGGLGGTGSSMSQANQGIAVVYRPNSPGLAGNAAPLPPGTVPPLQTEIRVMFDNSPTLSGNKTIQVAATADGIVTLTGTVGSDDEKKLIEAMTRITGGVRKVDSKLVVRNGG